MLSLTCLFYIIAGIQFWMTLYIINIVGCSILKVNIGFIIVGISGPSLGAVASGYFANWIGGYDHINAAPFTLLITVICSIVAAPFPFLSEFYPLIIILSVYLFFGGVLAPLMTGVMLSAV